MPIALFAFSYLELARQCWASVRQSRTCCWCSNCFLLLFNLNSTSVLLTRLTTEATKESCSLTKSRWKSDNLDSITVVRLADKFEKACLIASWTSGPTPLGSSWGITEGTVKQNGTALVTRQEKKPIPNTCLNTPTTKNPRDYMTTCTCTDSKRTEYKYMLNFVSHILCYLYRALMYDCVKPLQSMFLFVIRCSIQKCMRRLCWLFSFTKCLRNCKLSSYD